jgi:hypothetical protein
MVDERRVGGRFNANRESTNQPFTGKMMGGKPPKGISCGGGLSADENRLVKEKNAKPGFLKDQPAFTNHS